MYQKKLKELYVIDAQVDLLPENNMIERPKKIAICLNSPTLERALEQKEQLISLESEFSVEWDIRAERWTGLYQSVAQMWNEQIICTESEFMIFINPKSNVKPEYVHSIVNNLCNGFGYASTIAFGFWGCTKELIRKIGMADERFQGGNFEDNDFFNRMKYHNIAAYFDFKRDEYVGFNLGDENIFKQGDNRSLTNGVYNQKWVKKTDDSNICWKSTDYAQEKQLPRRIKGNKRLDISDSWKPWTAGVNLSYGIWDDTNNLEIQPEPLDFIWQMTNIKLALNINSDGEFNFNIKSSNQVDLVVCLTQQIEFEEYQTIQYGISANAKTNDSGDRSFHMEWKPKDQYYSLRVSYDGRMVHVNDHMKIPNYNIDLNLKTKKHLFPISSNTLV